MEPTTKGPHRNPTPKGCDPRIPRVCFFIFAFDLRVQPIGKWWTYFCICIHNQNLKHVYVIRMMPNSSGFFPNILTKQEPISRVQCNSNIKFEPSNFRNSKIDIYNWFFSNTRWCQMEKWWIPKFHCSTRWTIFILVSIAFDELVL
jgi:hypothetical protein